MESILSQSGGFSVEVIVVGKDVHRRLEPFGDEVRFIDTGSPVSPGSARNIGVDHASEECLVFIDSDAVASPGFLEGHLAAHEDFAPKIVGGAVTFPDDPYLVLCDNIATFHEVMPHLPSGEKRMVPSVNMSIHKRDFAMLGGFNDELAGEDTDLSARAAAEGMKVVFMPAVRVIHQPQRGQIRDVMLHAYKLGSYSGLLDLLIKKCPALVFLSRSGFWLKLFSPIVALMVLIKMLLFERLPLRYWHTLPMVFLLKCAWSVGLSERYRHS